MLRDTQSRQFDQDFNTQGVTTRIKVQSILIALVLCILASWPIILSGNHSGRGAWDDYQYHWVAITEFADQLPNPDISDYASATTPGYHLILAAFVKAGVGHMGAQLIASVWTLGLVGFLVWVLSARFGRVAALVALPMIASMYVLYPGIWLLPDNAGWLGVLGILLLSLRPNPTWKTWALSGLILCALILFRQVHIWIAATIWLSAWVGSSTQTPTTLSTLFSSLFDRTGRSFIALACTIPAFTVLFFFLSIWGGLVPPTFQNQHQGPNLVTPGFILTQLSILSVFYIPLLYPKLKETWKHHWGWILFAIFVGFVLGIVPESSYSVEAGRYSGWWSIINKIPTIADRSLVIMLGSIAGAVALAVWLSFVDRRDIWIWIGTLVAFVLAQSANHASWQRYHEPMLLIMILLILARSSTIQRSTRWVILGSVLLAGMFGMLTLSSLIGADPVETQAQLSVLP